MRFLILFTIPKLSPGQAFALAVVLLGAVLSGGCASAKKRAIANSLETVSGGYEHQGFTKMEQIRGTSVNGLLPFQTIGELYHHKPQRGALGAFGISEDDQTRVVTRRFCYAETNNPTETNEEDARKAIATVTQALHDLALNGAEIAVKRIDLLTLKTETAELTKKQATATNDAVKLTLTNNNSTNQAKASRLEREINKLEENKRTIETNLNAVLKYPNLIIARWATHSEKSGGLKAGDNVSLSGSSEDNFKGFVILAGFQTKNVLIGRDLFDRLNKQTKNMKLGHDFWDWVPLNPSVGSRMHVVTSLLQADHVAYLAERDLAIEIKAHLMFKFSELSNGAAMLKKLDQIAIDFASNVSRNYSNVGYVRQTSNPDYRTLADEKAFLQSSNKARQSTVMSVTTEVRDLFKLYKENKGDK